MGENIDVVKGILGSDIEVVIFGQDILSIQNQAVPLSFITDGILLVPEDR